MINIKVYHTETKRTLDFSFEPDIKACELWQIIYEKFKLAELDDYKRYKLYIKDVEEDEKNYPGVTMDVIEIDFNCPELSNTSVVEEYGLESGMELVVEEERMTVHIITEGITEGINYPSFGQKEGNIYIANATDSAVTVEIHEIEDKPAGIPERGFNFSAKAGPTAGEVAAGVSVASVQMNSQENVEIQDISPHGSDWFTFSRTHNLSNNEEVTVIFPNIKTDTAKPTSKKIKDGKGILITEINNKKYVNRSATKAQWLENPSRNWRKFGSKSSNHPHRCIVDAICPVCEEAVEDWQKK